MNAFEKYVNEMNGVLNERSIKAIQNEFSDVVTKMATLAKEFAAAEGDVKTNILAELKGLTAKKNALISELDAEVAGKDKDIQLVIKESETSEAYGSSNPHAKPAGLDKEETMAIAQKFADAMSKASGVKVTVNKRTLEEDSFDLDYDGEEFDGGSYNIYQNGNVMNMAIRENPVYGKKNDSVDVIAKNMKKMINNESFINEAQRKSIKKYKGLTFMTYYEAPNGYSVVGIGELKGVVGSPESFDTDKEAQEYAEEQIKDYLGEALVTEAAAKQFDVDFNTMVKNIKSGYGWIDPEYVADTWENSSDSIDFELVKGEIYKRLIAAKLLAYADDEDEESAGQYVKSLKELGIKESVVNEAEKFKSTKDFEDFLEEIDGMPENRIKRIMGKDYIDTPGGYRDEADDYDNDITEYMISNMGKSDFNELKTWWETNVAESFISESGMGEIDQLAQDSKDFKTFVKEFTKQYHDLSNAGEPGQFKDWLQTVYDSAKENMDESVIEESKRLITLKRQYTGSHPATTVGKIAAVRNKVLETIKDGKISTEQFDKIVSEISNNSKRWTKNNAKYFTISEDGVSLSGFGKKVLSSITVNEVDFKEFPKGYNPEIWVPGNFDKDISKYPNAKLNRKIVLDAAKKWDVTPEDAINYVEFGWHVDLSENNNNNMKTKFIFESFAEFVSSLNESNETLNEAFASTKLASLLTGANAMPKDLPQAFYNMAKLALDKIQDVDIIELDPQTAKKEKRTKAVYLYFTTNEKPNPYAGRDTWSGDRVIPANTLLAITDGSNEWMNAEWNSRGRSRQAQKDGRVLTTTKRDDSAGINKSGANVNYGTGISSMKQVAELADRAYCLDLTILTARYSTAALKAERDMARKGATALMDPRTFKDANKARYNEILAQKASAMPIDKIVLDAIDTLSNQIKDALSKGEKGQYGDIIIGVSPKGKEVKLSDASSLMRNILDDYQRYVGDVAQSEKEVAAGYGTSYYDRSLKERSKTIIDSVKKIENKNYAW